MTMNKGADQSIRNLSSLLKLLMSKGMRTHLSEGMEDLIRLYRICGEEAGLPIQDVKAFLKGITGKNLKFTEKPRVFVGGRHPIAFGNNQKKEFIGLMDGLCHAIKRGESEPFYLGISSFDPEIADYIQVVLSNTWDFERIQARISASESPQERNHRSNGDSKNATDSLTIPSTPYRLIRVMPASRFAKGFISRKSPWDEKNDEIPTINFDGWTTFIQIARSLLVNYQLVFGNFERLKLCQHCERLCFEKKREAKVFCGDRCRVDHNQQSEPKEKFRCRYRQNQWVKFQIINKINPQLKEKRRKDKDIPKHLDSFYVYKHQCEKCPACVKSGECPTLIEINDEAFRIMKILPGME